MTTISSVARNLLKTLPRTSSLPPRGLHPLEETTFRENHVVVGVEFRGLDAVDHLVAQFEIMGTLDALR